MARFAVECAEPVLGIFETARPDDPRPRAAIAAARRFADGAARSQALRSVAIDAHRAAREATDEAAAHAARAAGDAAGAAYLHPLAKATQVGHILRAAASAARAAEVDAGDDPAVGRRSIDAARQRATPALIEILRRYPPAPRGKQRVAQLMTELDDLLRDTRSGDAPAAGR